MIDFLMGKLIVFVFFLLLLFLGSALFWNIRKVAIHWFLKLVLFAVYLFVLGLLFFVVMIGFNS